MKKYQLLAFFLLPLCALQAQEQLGIRLSNYGGINSTLLNPAFHATTPFSWEVNLLEGAGHISNNYTYLRNTRVASLLKGPESLEFEFGPDLPPGTPEKDGSVVVDFFREGNRRNALALGSILGPSFYVQLNENHRVGLLTRARFMLSGRGVADPFNYYDYDSRPFYDPFSVDPLRGAVAGWTEVGINYLYQVETAAGAFAVGITARSLQAYEGSYWRNASTFQLQKAPNDSLGGTPIDFRFGYTTGNLEEGNRQAERNGGGFAADIGFIYTTFSRGDAPYDWKVGVSLIDIGRLNFRRNAANHVVRTDEDMIISTAEYQSFQGLDELEGYVELFSEQALGSPTASFEGSDFAIWLPSALSVQVDKSLGGPLFLGAAYTQGVPLGPGALQRGSHLAVAPRVENRWVEAAFPVSVYDWEEVRVGLALRLAFFTIGTSHLGSFISRSDLNASDFYFAVKLSPFQLFGNRDQGFSRGDGKFNSRGKGKVRCYDF